MGYLGRQGEVVLKGLFPWFLCVILLRVHLTRLSQHSSINIHILLCPSLLILCFLKYSHGSKSNYKGICLGTEVFMSNAHCDVNQHVDILGALLYFIFIFQPLLSLKLPQITRLNNLLPASFKEIRICIWFGQLDYIACQYNWSYFSNF